MASHKQDRDTLCLENPQNTQVDEFNFIFNFNLICLSLKNLYDICISGRGQARNRAERMSMQTPV